MYDLCLSRSGWYRTVLALQPMALVSQGFALYMIMSSTDLVEYLQVARYPRIYVKAGAECVCA